MIKGDSDDYNLLTKWSKGFDCKGNYSCEIGVRQGKGSQIIMDNVINNYLHIGVDPYGDIKYQHFDNDDQFKWGDNEPGVAPTYPNTMRDQMIKDFREYTLKGKFHFANMTDVDFMKHNVYSGLVFAFVFFDGPHTTKDVSAEALWFATRSAPHSRFIFDDHQYYRMDLISHILEFHGFKTVEAGDHKIILEKKC
jgi:hypothetical protein|tara:strand:- start:140 stop:724 length:585 start_codon:yes stop_codon:yes gene_type:complete